MYLLTIQEVDCTYTLALMHITIYITITSSVFTNNTVDFFGGGGGLMHILWHYTVGFFGGGLYMMHMQQYNYY